MTNNIILAKNNALAEVSIDIKLLCDALKLVEIGDVITYQELSDIIGRSVIKHRYLLQKARRDLRRDDGILFDCVFNTGLRRMSNSDIVNKVSTQPFQRMRSTVRNAVGDIHCIQNDQLSNNERITLNASQSLFGAIAEFIKPKAINLLGANIQEPLPVAKTLEFFK